MSKLNLQLYNFFLEHEVNRYWSEILTILIISVTLALITFVIHLIVKLFLLRIIERIVEKSTSVWDDTLNKYGVFRQLLRILPLAIFYYLIKIFIPVSDTPLNLISKDYLALLRAGTLIMIILTTMRASISTTDTLIEIVSKLKDDKPIKSYFQVIKILIYLIAFVLIVSVILQKSPLILLSSLGAMTAILLLIFKDSILGLVSSVKIAGYDMVRKGDWVTISKYNVDGTVVDISLNIVKVQNFDHTISTIPTFLFSNEPFINWRGMVDSGSRRIKRSLFIDMQTIKFCDEAMIRRFQKINILKPYLESKISEIGEDPSDKSINERRLTNVGTFRAYVNEYLKRHPKIESEETLLIRQKDPTDLGLPIEIYTFTKTTSWVEYENIQSDIFDHIIAAIDEFELKLYQSPSDTSFSDLLFKDENTSN